MQNHNNSLNLQVALTTKDTIQVEWSIPTELLSLVRGFKLRYQAIGSNVVQYSSMLSSSSFSHEITKLHENTDYEICVHVFTTPGHLLPVYGVRNANSTSSAFRMATDCISGSTGIDAFRVALGSTLGAFIALGVVVGFVLLSKCQARGGPVGRQHGTGRTRYKRGDDSRRLSGRSYLASTESDELSPNDDESFCINDDDDVDDDRLHYVDGGVKTAGMLTTSFDGEVVKCDLRDDQLETSLPDIWPKHASFFGGSSATKKHPSTRPMATTTTTAAGMCTIQLPSDGQQFNEVHLVKPSSDAECGHWSSSASRLQTPVSAFKSIADTSRQQRSHDASQPLGVVTDALEVGSSDRQMPVLKVQRLHPPLVRVLFVSSPRHHDDGLALGSQSFIDVVQPNCFGTQRLPDKQTTPTSSDHVGHPLDTIQDENFARCSRRELAQPSLLGVNDVTSSTRGRSFPDVSHAEPVLQHARSLSGQLESGPTPSAIASSPSAPTSVVAASAPTMRSPPESLQRETESFGFHFSCHDDTVRLMSSESLTDASRGKDEDLVLLLGGLHGGGGGFIRPNHSSVW